MTARPTTAAPTVTQVSIRTMAAVYVLASAGFLIALREAPERSVVIGAVVALGIGIVVGHLTGVGRWFGQLAGLFVGVCAMVLLAGAMAFGASLFGTDTVVLDPPYGVTVWVGAAITGLDWCRVARLRGYVVIALGLVLIGVATTESWAIPVAIVWLVGALGAFTLLEGDRRAALAQATPGLVGEARNPRPQDLVTTIVVALALGLVAALVLSAPSCSPNGGGGRGSGSESGQGLGQGSGSGDFGTDSGGTSGTPDHRYVPDPTGRFLVPDDGSTDWDGLTTSEPIPDPERVPELAPGETRTTTDDDTTVVYRDLGDGAVEVTITRPGEPTRRYRLRDRSDGLTSIQRLRPDGTVEREFLYDPEGELADEASGPANGDTPATTTTTTPEAKESKSFKPNWAVIGGVLAVLAAIGLAVWWWLRRTPPASPGPPVEADVRPWVLDLVLALERLGAARGRPRRAEESVVSYTQALHADAVPDTRVTDVGEVLSAALFGQRDGPEVQAWAEATFATIAQDYPAEETVTT